MPMTPLDAENMRFPVVMRGYDRRQVDDFCGRVAAALEEYINQQGALRARIGELETALARYRENEELLKNSVVLAQRTADELAHAAHQRADGIVGAAHAEAAAIRQELGRLKAEREQFEYAFYGLLYGFLKRLEHANPALRPAGGAPSAAAPEAPFQSVLEAAGEAMPLEPAPPPPQAAPKAPLLTEMLSNQLPASPPASRANPRDSDSLSFASALAQAGAVPASDASGQAAPAPPEAAGGGMDAPGQPAPQPDEPQR